MNAMARAVLCSAALFSSAPVFAQGTPAEARLRDQLRQEALALRDAQDTVAQLKNDLAQANQQLETQRAIASSQSSAKPNAADLETHRALEQRNAEIAQMQGEMQQAQQLLGRWQEAYQQAATLARARDADAKKFERLYQEQNTRSQTCEKDNAELVHISNELVKRYKDKGVWQSLRTSEPFTGISRSRLETLAQTYHSAIIDHTVTPPGAPGSAPADSPASTPASATPESAAAPANAAPNKAAAEAPDKPAAEAPK
jgi:hypothetical protein